MTAKRRQIVRVEDLIGTRVRAADGRTIGRIEEICVKRLANGDYAVEEYHLGTGALLERLAIVRQLLGRRPRMRIARWDQIDIRRPEAPMLTCAPEQLRDEAQ